MASSSAISTDSYPTNFRSFSHYSNNAGDIPPSVSLEKESSDAVPTEPDVVEAGCPAVVQRLKWDKEQFDIRRPYERKNYDRPYRELPNYFAAFGGRNVKPQKCSAPNAFARRTPIEEVFHKRNITSICPAAAPQPLEDCVGDVIVADNVSSSVIESKEEVEQEEVEQAVKERVVSKECCKTFFRARRALLRSELFDGYFNRAPSPTNDSDSSDAEEMPEELQAEPEPAEQHAGGHRDPVGLADRQDEGASSVSCYRPPEIVHKESKPAVVEAQEQFLQRLRTRYLHKFDSFRQRMEEAEQARKKPPEPFDGEKYMAEYPAPDIRNETKARFRESLKMRLEELNELQRRPVRQYPKTVKQFVEYKEQIMDDRRQLRDEATLVEDYFRRANTPKELPEAKLEVKRFRLADFEATSADADTEAEPYHVAKPVVYHTCMTREEWGHWIARCTKSEKLKLPKVNVPRVPVLVRRCHESPIRAYIEGRLDGPRIAVPPTAKGKNSEAHHRPKKIIHSSGTAPSRPTMRDLLFDPRPDPEPMSYEPYDASLRPYSDIVEERFRIGERQRKARRQLRKSRMWWIEDLVDEICRRKRA